VARKAAQKYETVDEYVASFPVEVQVKLQAMRATVRAAAPEAVELISYGMPTYKVRGRALVHFAGWTSYLSLYPTPAEGVDGALERELKPYRATKATARFPLDRELPLPLVARIVEALLHQREDGL